MFLRIEKKLFMYCINDKELIKKTFVRFRERSELMRTIDSADRRIVDAISIMESVLRSSNTALCQSQLEISMGSRSISHASKKNERSYKESSAGVKPSVKKDGQLIMVERCGTSRCPIDKDGDGDKLEEMWYNVLIPIEEMEWAYKSAVGMLRNGFMHSEVR
ncbi:Uncharacterized protein TCM_028556 [Theobroma cacao]|uniref:Uncharacterized protein n=1 Tax=Theobroma cacao TaxID=3641 RepID=A0A061GAP6_THECC|nr:Uncharacterized protein TCM_028556 [Theobroma cacao]